MDGLGGREMRSAETVDGFVTVVLFSVNASDLLSLLGTRRGDRGRTCRGERGDRAPKRPETIVDSVDEAVETR